MGRGKGANTRWNHQSRSGRGRSECDQITGEGQRCGSPAQPGRGSESGSSPATSRSVSFDSQFFVSAAELTELLLFGQLWFLLSITPFCCSLSAQPTRNSFSRRFPESTFSQWLDPEEILLEIRFDSSNPFSSQSLPS